MSDYIQDVTDGSFEQIVLHSGRPVLVDFWAEWCAPCRTLAPIVETVAKQYAGAAEIVKLNVDDNPAVTQRYGIQGIPTLIVFKEGREQERTVGVASREAISRMIDRHIGSVAGQEAASAPDVRKVG